MTVTKRVKIFGEVQGVGFRYSAYYAAKNFGVNGWVRNCQDGSVEAVVQGNPEAVESFISWMRKGPSLAHVFRVDVTEAAGEFHEFKIEGTV